MSEERQGGMFSPEMKLWSSLVSEVSGPSQVNESLVLTDFSTLGDDEVGDMIHANELRYQIIHTYLCLWMQKCNLKFCKELSSFYSQIFCYG